jgi:DNA polymerase III epsilon subunit-like protein
MANTQKICVFDFETDGIDADSCSPVQIAAIVIDPVHLEVVPDSEFNITLRPEILDAQPTYSYGDSDVLDFHAKVKGSSKDDILKSWKEYQKQEHGWSAFVSYLEMYHSRSHGGKKSCFTAPIAAGYNINRFDLRIIERLSKKYNNLNKEGRSSLFYPRDVIDLMNVVFYWFEGNNELKNYTLDNLRDYLGISKDGAHDALKDVKDTADILIRFLKLHRGMSEKVKFKGSFIKV